MLSWPSAYHHGGVGRGNGVILGVPWAVGVTVGTGRGRGATRGCGVGVCGPCTFVPLQFLDSAGCVRRGRGVGRGRGVARGGVGIRL